MSDSNSGSLSDSHLERERTVEELRIIKEYEVDVLEAFIEAFNLEYDDVGYDQFTDSYHGEFDSSCAFAKHCTEAMCEYEIPSWIVIDYERTWTRNLCHDYTECNGYFFRNW